MALLVRKETRMCTRTHAHTHTQTHTDTHMHTHTHIFQPPFSPDSLLPLPREGTLASVLCCPAASPVANHAFDVTPARLVTALITERGVCPASEAGLLALFPEHAP